MTSIPLLVDIIECKIFRCIFLKNKRFFLNFFLLFSNLLYFKNIFKKDDPHSLCISEITDNERRA